MYNWKQLKLYSQERRRERYTIIYIWRMLEGQVPCLNSLDGGAKVTSIWHIRRGRECKIPCITHHAPRNIQALKHATLPVRGQQLFNILPRDIRNMTDCKVDIFKRRFDTFLSTIPDEPQVLGYTAQRRADSNSILHMGKFADAHWPSQVEVFGEADSPSRRGCAYKKGMVLYSAVSSPLDRSKRFTLSSPGRPVHSYTVLGFSWKHSSHAAIAQRLFTHISTTVYSQVLIYTAESTEAS